MADSDRRLFIGIKITTKLQSRLDSPAPGTERYFKGDNADYLEIVTFGEDKIIGRYVHNAFPIRDITDVGRNVRSIVSLIAHGDRISDDSVHLYASPSET